MNDAPTFRVLAVCSHNRTRSVMVAAMLQSMLDEQLGAAVAKVSSAGFGPNGLPAIPDAVAAMQHRGLDVSAHRSRTLTESMLDDADLVLTAERDHVVRIATMVRSAFTKSFTLPEFVERSTLVPSATGDLGAWVTLLTEQRTTAGYLRAQVGEIADPTGAPPRVFAAAVDDLHERCARAADRIAAGFR